MGSDRKIRWLQLSDFHQGVDRLDQRAEVPELLRRLETDLKKLQRDQAPIDLVLFTGDLTQRAAPEQFAALADFLGKLFRILNGLGSQPVLLCVPGNHDLVRPVALDPTTMVFNQWEQRPEIQEAVWLPESSHHRIYQTAIATAFANYVQFVEDWQRTHPLPAGVCIERNGLLPGDFAASIEKGGAKLMVAGLNSAFLQLGDGDYQGRLDMSHHQLRRVAVDGWEDRHQAALLLSHHPPNWLSARSFKQYRELVVQRGRFAAHLFGHMHEPRTQETRDGGGHERAHIQAASLWSREPYGPERKTDRLHGYSIGQVEFDGSQGVLRLWPRWYLTRPDGESSFAPDFQRYHLQEDGQRQNPVRFQLLQPLPTVVPLTVLPPPTPSTPPTPPMHLVVRQQEQELREYLLGITHQPVLLEGPPFSGKKTLLRQALAAVRTSGPAGSRPLDVLVDFDDLGLERSPSLEPILAGIAQRIATRVAKAIGLSDKEAAQWVKQNFDQYTYLERLNYLLENDIFPRLNGRLVLRLHAAHRLFTCKLGDDLLGMMRAWADRTKDDLASSLDAGGYIKLRLVLVVSTMEWHAAALPLGPFGSAFINQVKQTEVNDLSQEEVRRLLASYPAWPGSSADWLTSLVGGQPNLLRLTIGSGLQVALPADDVRLWDACRSHLEHIHQSIRRHPALLAAVRAFLRGRSLTWTESRLLVDCGLARRTETGVSFRYPIYEAYLRAHLKET